jgi:DNA uptake protein ComE-like DNA-binding protein
MARRHWLDPLARRLLIASGQIKPPAAGVGGDAAAMGGAGGAGAEARHHDSVERDLLALRLAQNPALALRNATEVRHAAALGWSLDVNRATAADWGRLPGCGREQVDLLLRLQKGGVQLSGPEDLRAVLELDAALLASWLPLLRFRWYGEPPAPAGPVPVAVNLASARDLATLPELTAERCARLLRERARGSFRDLADLRDRLGLPPAVVEQWIARVSFEPGRPGPDLPLGPATAAARGGGSAAPPGPATSSPAAPKPPAPGPSGPGPSAPRPTASGPSPSGPTASGPSGAKDGAGPSLPPGRRDTSRRLQ